MDKNNVNLFISAVKEREGLKFDGQVAELMNIDRRILANYKHKASLPFKLQEWYCKKYDIPLKDFHKDIKSESTGETLRNPEYAEKRSLEIEVEDLRLENEHLSKKVIELQEQLIELLKDK